jgi:hypothetical protein
MHKLILASIATLGILLPVSATEEGAWSYRLGVSYRDIGDVDVEDMQFSNPTLSGLNGGYVNGATHFQVTDDTFILDNTLNVQNDIGGVSLDKLSTNTGSQDLGQETGFIFTAEKGLNSVGNSRVALDLSVSYHNAEESSDSAASVVSDRYSPAVAPATGSGPASAPNPTVHPGSTIGVGGAGVGVASTAGMLNFDMEMDLFTFGAGLKGIYDADSFRLSVGAGPTISVSNIETDVVESATWSKGANSGSDLYRDERSDDSLDLIFGGYLSLGAEVRLSEAVGLGAEWRYDHAFGDAGTDHADVDVSGQSGQFFLILNY